MDMIDLSCPKCGAAMKPDTNNVYALCEYCGHGVLLPETTRMRLREQQEEARRDAEPQTQTQRYQKQLEKEKENRPPQDDTADENLGTALLRLFGLPFRLRYFFSFLLLIAAGVCSFLVANRLFTDEYRQFYLIAGIAATAVGAVCMWLSYRVYRSVPLGVGLGLLLSLLMQTLR